MAEVFHESARRLRGSATAAARAAYVYAHDAAIVRERERDDALFSSRLLDAPRKKGKLGSFLSRARLLYALALLLSFSFFFVLYQGWRFLCKVRKIRRTGEYIQEIRRARLDDVRGFALLRGGSLVDSVRASLRLAGICGYCFLWGSGLEFVGIRVTVRNVVLRVFGFMVFFTRFFLL